MGIQEAIREGWEMLSPFLPLVSDDERARCEAHYGRITGSLALGNIDAELYRELITRSQLQLRKAVRENMARPSENLPGGTIKTEPRSRVRRSIPLRRPEPAQLPQWMRDQRAAFGGGASA